MIEQSKITENINECRAVLALEIKKLQDSKKKAVKEKRLQDSKNEEIIENRLTSVFIFLGKLLQDYKTDAELKIKILEKIQTNDSTIDAISELLLKTYDPNFTSMITKITQENNLYKSLLIVDEEPDSESLNRINSDSLTTV